jgi:DNA (cytosine-5)-methyltransferase 1
LIIGVRNDLPGYFLPTLKPAPRAEPRTWLGAAIGDLPILRAGSGEDEREYDLERREKHLREGGKTARKYLFQVLEIGKAGKLTNHVARPHSERDLRDFALLKEGENSATAMRDRGVKFEFPYDKSSFKDRYTRQSRWHPCSTIVAHLSKDGLMFIHPTQNRSLTPREAARIQSFPDWFRFPEARTHSFRLIGNAVPPLIGEAVGLAVKEFLGTTAASAVLSRAPAGRNERALDSKRKAIGEGADHDARGGRAPHDRPSVARELEKIARLDRRALRALPKDQFLTGWRALLFLFPDLHPDNARDHGDHEEEWNADPILISRLGEKARRRFTRSGWPVSLDLIGREAWRRHETKQITDDELYCSESQRAGLEALRREAAKA